MSAFNIRSGDGIVDNDRIVSIVMTDIRLDSERVKLTLEVTRRNEHPLEAPVRGETWVDTLIVEALIEIFNHVEGYETYVTIYINRMGELAFHVNRLDLVTWEDIRLNPLEPAPPTRPEHETARLVAQATATDAQRNASSEDTSAPMDENA